jgi:hypothetical protein
MIPYKNLNGDSIIVGYDLTPGAIEVYFRDRYAYTYAEAISGPENIAQMYALAVKGRGLNYFINRHVRKGYVFKRVWG